MLVEKRRAFQKLRNLQSRSGNDTAAAESYLGDWKDGWPAIGNVRRWVR
jgi:hypothetical protein